MFDLHVHAAPDVTARLVDDRDVVAAYADAGFTGCVLKGHYESTVGRAVAAGRGQSLQVYGGVALNQHVGGINPAAVAACLSAGGRVIWMPTADSHTQETAGLPRLCGIRRELATTTYAIPPVDDSNADAVRTICEMVAAADAVLATGHLSTAEVRWLLRTATECGVRRLLLTHPSYTVPGMSASEAVELTEYGALAEITTFQLLHQPGCDAARLAAFAKHVGLERIVLSSDTGQPNSPSPPEALRLLIESLTEQGLDRGELDASASERPARLIT